MYSRCDNFGWVALLCGFYAALTIFQSNCDLQTGDAQSMNAYRYSLEIFLSSFGSRDFFLTHTEFSKYILVRFFDVIRRSYIFVNDQHIT